LKERGSHAQSTSPSSSHHMYATDKPYQQFLTCLPARLVLPRSLSILWCVGSTPYEQKDHVNDYMQQTCFRDNSSCSSFQENSCLLCTQKFHKRVKNSPPLNLILSEMSPVLTISSHILKAYFNIILPSTPRHYMYSLTPFNFI
jgi:hypothetical protein